MPNLDALTFDGSTTPDIFDIIKAILRRSGYPRIDGLIISDSDPLVNGGTEEAWGEAVLSLLTCMPSLSSVYLAFSHINVLSSDLLRLMTYRSRDEENGSDFILLRELGHIRLHLHENEEGVEAVMGMLSSRTASAISSLDLDGDTSLDPLTCVEICTTRNLGESIQGVTDWLQGEGVEVILDFWDDYTFASLSPDSIEDDEEQGSEVHT